MDISPDTSPRPASRADQESAKDHKSSAKSVPDARQSSSDGPGTTGTSSVIWGEGTCYPSTHSPEIPIDM